MLRLDLVFFDKQFYWKAGHIRVRILLNDKNLRSVTGMNILTSIRSFLKHDLGTFLGNCEEFYYKDLLALVQGIVSKKHSSISSMSKDALIDLSHTALTRFVNEHASFWSELDDEISKRILKDFKSKPMLLVVDDTQLPRSGKKIPFVTKAYDHCTKEYQNAQVILTIGAISNETFLPLEMLFSNVGGTSTAQQLTKNDQLIQWLKDNSEEIKGSTLLGDSWFTHSYVVEAAIKWHGMKFIGNVKGNYVCHDTTTGFIGKISKYVEGLSDSAFECFEIDGKKVYVHETIAEIQDFRLPMKMVVCKDESGRQITLASTDVNMSGIEIVSTYLKRWNIEMYFKSAKQEFNLGKCRLRTESGQRHWMILIKLAYLIFKEHMEYLKRKYENMSKQDVFRIIQDALSYLSSALKGVKGNYDLLETNFEMGEVT